METETVSETTTPEAAPAAQPDGERSQDTGAEAPEQKATATAQSDKAAPASDSGKSKEVRLAELIAKGEKDPNIQYTNEELDLFDEYREGKLKPADLKKLKKEKDKAAAAAKPAEGQESEKDPQPKAKEDDGEEAEDADKEKGDEPDPKDEPLAEALKEVGAEKVEDLVPKIRELRKQLTGKDAQAVARLTRDNEQLTGRIRNEMALWNDVRSGDPTKLQHALAFVERSYGVKLVPASQAGQAPAKEPAGASGGDSDFLIPKDKFIDEESAELANGVFTRMASRIKAMEEKISAFDTEKERLQQVTSAREAQDTTINEMVEVAGLKGLEDIAKIPNLRQAIKEWYFDKKDDPRLEVFDQVIEVANKEKVSLKMAWAWMRAQGLDTELARAKEQGRREAYDQKPSRTLAGIGGKGHQEYQQYTDEQLKEMSEDYRKCPDNWFDAEDRPDPKKIPRRAHKYFFAEASTE